MFEQKGETNKTSVIITIFLATASMAEMGDGGLVVGGLNHRRKVCENSMQIIKTPFIFCLVVRYPRHTL